MPARANRSVDRQIGQWNLKYDPDYMKSLMEKAKASWKNRAEAAFADLYASEQLVKQQLNRHAIPISMVSSYLCYAREVWKAQTHYHGELLAGATYDKIAKWTNRKLERPILVEIARLVYDVPVE